MEARLAAQDTDKLARPPFSGPSSKWLTLHEIKGWLSLPGDLWLYLPGGSKPLHLTDAVTRFSVTKARMLKVVSAILEARDRKTAMTLRQLYYVARRGSDRSATVEKNLRAVSLATGLERPRLGVLAEARGQLFVWGHYLTHNGTNATGGGGDASGLVQVSLNAAFIFGDRVAFGGGLRISARDNETPRIKVIIFVESAAAFHTMCDDHANRGAILVTSGGSPTFATRMMLLRLKNRFPKAPILALVDPDSSGMRIMLNLVCSPSQPSTVGYNSDLALVEKVFYVGIKPDQAQTALGFAYTTEPKNNTKWANLFAHPRLRDNPKMLELMGKMMRLPVKVNVSMLNRMSLVQLAVDAHAQGQSIEV